MENTLPRKFPYPDEVARDNFSAHGVFATCGLVDLWTLGLAEVVDWWSGGLVPPEPKLAERDQYARNPKIVVRVGVQVAKPDA